MIGPEQLGSSSAIFSWNPRNNLLAVSGDKVSKLSCFMQQSAGSEVNSCFRTCVTLQRQVHIFDKRGKPYYHITLPAPEFPCNEALSGTRALQVTCMLVLQCMLFCTCQARLVHQSSSYRLSKHCAHSGTPQESCWPSCPMATLTQWCGLQPPATLHTSKPASRCA